MKCFRIPYIMILRLRKRKRICQKLSIGLAKHFYVDNWLDFMEPLTFEIGQ